MTSTPVQQRVLYVQDEENLLGPVLQLYQNEMGVSIQPAGEQQPGLSVVYQQPTGRTAVNLSESCPLLMTALNQLEQQDCYGIPVGQGQYGYLADVSQLRALLGEKFQMEHLRRASWQEWVEFVRVVQQWIAQPSKQKVVLAGHTYWLAEQASEPLASLAGVFTLAGETAYSDQVLTPVLGTVWQTPEQVANRGKDTAQISQSLGALVQLIGLESVALADASGAVQPQSLPQITREGALQAFAEGRALFYRTSTSEKTLLSPEKAEQVELFAVKFPFEESLLSGEGLTMEQLQKPVSTGAAWLTVSAEGSPEQQKEAQALLLWAYTHQQAASLAPQLATAGEDTLVDLSQALSDYVRQDVQRQADTLLTTTQ